MSCVTQRFDIGVPRQERKADTFVSGDEEVPASAGDLNMFAVRPVYDQ